MDLQRRVREAEGRIRPFVFQTPFVRSEFLAAELGAELWLKCENLQHTGSFKVRGVFNRLLVEPAGIPPRVITASTGNHGAALAYATSRLGSSATVFVPTDASGGKVALVERLGATIRRHGDDSAKTEAHARVVGRETGEFYLSPYNDIEVVAGQGSIAVELARQGPKLDAIFVAVGGGGLISGIAGFLDAVSPETKIYGCSPEPSAVMIRSVAAGEILDIPSGPTLSEGTAGGVEAGAITFPLVRELVDEFVVVPEEQTRRTLREFLEVEQMQIEGAAAMALAACRMKAAEFPGGRVAVVLCGGNIDLQTIRRILD